MRVREVRHARGLSQQALAGDGISAGYVSLIESGKRTPSAATTERLAARLGVPVSTLLGGDEPLASDRARTECNFAKLALANGDAAQAVRTLDAVDLDVLDSHTFCDASLVLAEALQETGDLDRAVAVLEAVVTRCRREHSWVMLASATTTLTAMYIESGDIARSVETAQRALAEVEEAGLSGTDEHLRLGSVFLWALIESGDLLFASRRVADLIEVAEQVGTARARGSVYWNAALVAQQRGLVPDALRLTERAVALLSEQENSRDLPRLRLNHAWLLLNQPAPRPREALLELDRAESDPAMVGSRLDLGTAATYRGRANLMLGELYDAADDAARALSLLGASEHVERASALVLLGDVGTAQLDLDLAHESYREAERVLSRMSASRRVARLWRELGDALRDLGELDRAVDAYDRGFAMMGLTPRPRAGRATLKSLARRSASDRPQRRRSDRIAAASD